MCSCSVSHATRSCTKTRNFISNLSTRLIALQIFHTIAIILLIISTCILIISITVRMINDQYIFKYEVPFIVAMFVTSVSEFSFLFRFVNDCKQNYLFINVLQLLNFFNGLLYYTSIKLVRTTCENY